MKKLFHVLVAMFLGVCCFTACGGGEMQESSNSSSEVKQENTIEFVNNEITLHVGETLQLEVVTSKPNVYVFWSARDTHVATISDNGVVTAIAEGQTICYAEFAGKSAMCLVKVVPKGVEPVLSISASYAGNSVTIYKGETLPISITVKLGDAVVEDAQIEYSVASEIASVTDGILSADGVGETTITATVEYNGQTATTTISVTIVEVVAESLKVGS